MTTTTWRNWAGNETASPVRVLEPASAEEVAAAVLDAVRDGLRVKAVGSGHSFSGAAVAPGLMIRPDAMDQLLAVDRATGLVTVAAGMPLHRLNLLLAEAGLAMEILGDIGRPSRVRSRPARTAAASGSATSPPRCAPSSWCLPTAPW